MGAARQIKQIDIETGEIIEVYRSIKEAAYDNFLNPEQLSAAIRNKNGLLQQHKLKFEYA